MALKKLQPPFPFRPSQRTSSRQLKVSDVVGSARPVGPPLIATRRRLQVYRPHPSINDCTHAAVPLAANLERMLRLHRHSPSGESSSPPYTYVATGDNPGTPGFNYACAQPRTASVAPSPVVALFNRFLASQKAFFPACEVPSGKFLREIEPPQMLPLRLHSRPRTSLLYKDR